MSLYKFAFNFTKLIHWRRSSLQAIRESNWNVVNDKRFDHVAYLTSSAFSNSL